MSYPSQASVGDDRGGSLLPVVDAQQASTGADLAASPFAIPGFFLGWILLGVSVGAILVRRGHDPKTMLAVGAGLGPLMLLVATETVRRREDAARPLVVEPGRHMGGPIDVLVFVSDDPNAVRYLVPMLEAVRSDLRTLVLARSVSYEWIEGDLDNDTVRAESAVLMDAAALLPFDGAGLELQPGTTAIAAQRFRTAHDRPLVLFAVDDADIAVRPTRPR